METELVRTTSTVGESCLHLQLTPAYRRNIFVNEQVRELTKIYLLEKFKKLGLTVPAYQARFTKDFPHLDPNQKEELVEIDEDEEDFDEGDDDEDESDDESENEDQEIDEDKWVLWYLYANHLYSRRVNGGVIMWQAAAKWLVPWLMKHALQAGAKGFNDARGPEIHGKLSGRYIWGKVTQPFMQKAHGTKSAVDDVPADYNFFCYHGSKGFDYALAVALPRNRKAVHFDKHWNVWEGEFTAEEAARLVNPPNFDEMVRVAEALSRGFDFVRIDLYNVAGRVYFGEVTCTPAGGLGPVNNEFRARMRNEMWELDADNPQLYHKPIAA